MRRGGARASSSAYDNAHSAVSNHEIFALLFAALGTFFVLRGLWNLVSALDSRKWPHVPGVIASSQGPAALTYHFRIQGEEHTGHRARFGDSSRTNLAFLLAGTSRYAPGTKVTVHYNPENPRDCVLAPGWNAFLMMDLVFGAVFFAVAVGFLGVG